MRIEFGTIGNGTNVEVMLIDETEPGWGIVDRFYTCATRFTVQIDSPLTREWFLGLEEMSPKPIIGGQFAAHHPYWKERADKRKLRVLVTPLPIDL